MNSPNPPRGSQPLIMDVSASNRDGRPMIVDLRNKKRLRQRDAVDHPQQKIATITRTNPKYCEGTNDDILKLMNEENIFDEKGVFLKDQIPSQFETDLETLLANGAFSKNIRVYKDQYVCKEVKAEKFAKDEVRHLCQLDYVYISKIFGLVRKNNEFHIYMEYCGINLYEWINVFEFESNVILEITKQLCMAVEFAHNKKIIHLDIKPRNICLSFKLSGLELKLTDWGSSKSVSRPIESPNITLTYAAPELLYLYIRHAMRSIDNQDLQNYVIQVTQKFCRNYNNIENISTLSDSFSIGLTIMFLITRKHFYDNLPGKPLLPLCKMYAGNPNAAKDLIAVNGDPLIDIARRLVEGESHKRISVKDVQKMIKEYQRSIIDSNTEMIQEIRQPDPEIPDPENQSYNVPNLDMLF